MSTFNWIDDYSVGVKQFDDHHKRLIGYINELQDAMLVGKGKDVLGNILKNLIDYTQIHFKAEETQMLKWNYPAFLGHQKEHLDLTKTALELQEKFESGQTALSVKTIAFLKDWLTHHILVVDKQYSSFFNKAGVK
jgi:hemerythrin